MDYRIEIHDSGGRRVAQYTEVALLEAVRRGPDQTDRIQGILPLDISSLNHGMRVKVFVEERLFCDAAITEVVPQWSDTRKLILDEYVRFHEVLEFLAEQDKSGFNTYIGRAFAGQSVSSIVKDAIDAALGPIHYTVDHAAYPDGAVREYQKFVARKTVTNELAIGGFATGQWVGAARINAAGAYAKDGDTIAGLIVDGVTWPDLRFLMIDAEETSLNSHTVSRHPETGDWTSPQYNASGYKLRADAAKSALQSLIDTYGIDYIELNPHRDAAGAYDDRVDVYGRYIALVYGGGRCFNAAMVELGHADVYLYQDGRFHDPAMTLKDFFSYAGAHAASIQDAPTAMIAFDGTGGVMDLITAMSYAAGGYVWSLDNDYAVKFCRAERPSHVWFFEPVAMGVSLGSRTAEMSNAIYFEGNPISGTVQKTYTRGESIEAYGFHARHLDHLGISREEDADKLVSALLDDLAYPSRIGQVTFFYGNADITVGDIVELRNVPLRRFERSLPHEWGGRFDGKLVGRVKEVAHRFSGTHVSTRVTLTSPLRSVESPLAFMVRSQPAGSALFQFRLDDAGVGLDDVNHLD